MPIMESDTPLDSPTNLVTKRDPSAKRKTPASGAGSIGDKAVKDATVIVVVAWGLLFLLAFSVRRYNV